MTEESQLKKDITDFLRQRGEIHLRLNSGVIKRGSRFIHLCPPGTADIVVFRVGWTGWIEVKTGKTQKARAELQAAFRTTVLAMGHAHCQARSLDDVVRFLGK